VAATRAPTLISFNCRLDSDQSTIASGCSIQCKKMANFRRRLQVRNVATFAIGRMRWLFDIDGDSLT
jgi:hypothetical protein